MSSKFTDANSPWSSITGPNLGYVMEMYDIFQESPEAIDPEFAELFRQYGSPLEIVEQPAAAAPSATADVSADKFGKVLAAVQLADAIRAHGHLASNIYPLNDRPKDASRLEPSAYGLTEQDLKEVPVSLLLPDAPSSVKDGLEAITYLRSLYTDKVAYEFSHIVQPQERSWIQSKIESGQVKLPLSAEKKKELLNLLTHVEGFEKFIHRTFVGQKRFSIEGLDTLVVLMDELVRLSESKENIMIGMAHRGRLNVLTHVLNKPYEMMFAGFAHVGDEAFLPEDGSLKITKGWFGDVKYHMGAAYTSPAGPTIKLAYNPSHLEVVSPVVAGQTRAAQELTNQKGKPAIDSKKAYAILVHGDAAFPGQGVVTETLNFSRIPGYQTGGSIHVIANNLIGFTTEQYDSRSTHYSSDPAKGYEIPVIHVNADDPEAVVAVARLAFEYREKFGKDILIDLIGYRRYGHNEMDEPLVTNPLMYHGIHKHPTVRELYGRQLTGENILAEDDVKKLDADTQKEMQEAYDRVKENSSHDANNQIPEAVLNGFPEVPTGIDKAVLTKLNEELLSWPADFSVFSKLARILKRREEPFTGKGKIDWAHAEVLAFGSILQEGNPIRLTGQDAQRGTFAHRHLVLHDDKTGAELVPLHHISDAKASFVVYNSPLSEAAILGYEYGYNVENEKALVVWEAQYGDFANMAQMMFDQFISASHAKWGQKSGLVMLLPHAYEGQGPEHSSARLERFLQMGGENNWTVANLSSAANYFHIMRRQAKMLGEDSIRPLIIVTPKSLLRHPLVGAEVDDLAQGHFQTVIEQPGMGQEAEKVERILFASGKMAIDLAERVKDGAGFEWAHIVRVEQLYPFPAEKIQAIVDRYPNAKELAWVQEEPQNMGSWSFAEPYLREIANGKPVNYHGRIKRSSPAEGDGEAHKAEQARILDGALAQS
ncbi:2-oxoglutarate dehydrogenase E1 component [Planomicrobium sp. CPCC 101110]|uniref:2-oxoglutarate dehydrogenase E1 component n=1 Tax=Planomicrobium sp. CPCC 101110 TaxID=2599619 RepID=UPI0011B48845|nr:2-oxoglutarate dehydrogenase E1 component [Planomicrobium sp. CPCC 101110]TWT25721.1 2-oxoglutarate dehydrogenase E1 component [Planomicrobium sp. CPCC 101110]